MVNWELAAAAVGVGLLFVGFSRGAGASPAPSPSPSPSPAPSPAPSPGAFVFGTKRGFYSPAYNRALFAQLADIAKRYPRVPFEIVVNPSNGVGEQYDADFRSKLEVFSGLPNVFVDMYIPSWYGGEYANPMQGTTWSGLTSTTYPKYGTVFCLKRSNYDRLISEGKPAWYLPEMMDRCRQWYPMIRGYKIDEMYNGSDPVRQQWYKDFIDIARPKGFTRFGANPGASAPSVYFQWFDYLMTREGQGWPLSVPNNGMPEKVGFVVFNVPSITEQNVRDIAPQCRYMFATNDSGNPYDTNPSYLENLILWIDRWNSANGKY